MLNRQSPCGPPACGPVTARAAATGKAATAVLRRAGPGETVRTVSVTGPLTARTG